MEQGFDRGVDFNDMKQKLIDAYSKSLKEYDELDPEQRYYPSKKRKIVNKIIYQLAAMIQLINGSRISEACDSLKQFLASDDYDTKVITKIAKSESLKTNKEGKKYKTKPRYRKLLFPSDWIEIPDRIEEDVIEHCDKIELDILKKRVLNYLLKYHECNTHSLRYACINHLLYHKKLEASLVARHVGHSNMNMLVKYTQNKEAEKIFDLDL